MKKYVKHFFLSGLFLFMFLFAVVTSYSGLGFAQTRNFSSSMQNTIINLTPNESKIIHLNKNASSVVIANPVHASVFLDTPQIVVIVPGTPGATSFTVLDKDGRPIIKRDIVVSERKNKYVRIQRVCTDAVDDCVPSSVYFCPDGCHQVFTASPDSESGGVSSRVPTSGVSFEEEGGEE